VETEVRATLVADATAFTSGMRKAEQQLNQFDHAANRTNHTLLKLSGIIGTITAATALFGRRAFQAATEVDELNITISAVGESTGLGSKAIQEAAAQIQGMGIEMAESRRIATQFAQQGLDISQAWKLASVAQDLAVVSSSNSTQTMQRLVRGVMTGNSVILRGAGITTQAGEAYKRYADQLGIAAGSLNAAQRQQAIINSILEEGERVAGAYERSMDNAGKVLRSFPRIMQNIRIAFGDTLLTGLNPLILGAYKMTEAFQAAINTTVKTNRETGEVTETVGGLVNAMRALETVFTAIMAPIEGALGRLREWIASVQVSEEQALRFANRLAPMVPIITSVAAAMSALAATTILKFIPGFRAFAGVINPGVIAFLAFIATSTEVQAALGNLWNTIQPLIPTIQQLAEMVLTFAMAVGTTLVPLLVEFANILIQSLTPLLNWLATSEYGETIVRTLAIAFLIAKTNLAQFVWALSVSGYKALVNFGRRLIVSGGQVRAYAALAVQAKTAQDLATLGTMAWSGALTKLKVAIRGVLAATGIGLLVIGLSIAAEAFMRAWQTSQKFRDIVIDAINKVIDGIEMLANAAIKFLNVFLPKAAEIGAVSFNRMARSIIKDAEDVGSAMGVFGKLVERLQRPGSDEDLARQAEIAAMMAGTMDTAAGAASRLAEQLKRIERVGYEFNRWVADLIDNRDPMAKAFDEVSYQVEKFENLLASTTKTADELIEGLSNAASTIRSQLGQALSYARQELGRAQQAFEDFSNTISTSILGIINFNAALDAGSGLRASFENLRDVVGSALAGMIEFRNLASSPPSRQFVGFVRALGDALDVFNKQEETFLSRLAGRRDQMREFGEAIQTLAQMGISEEALRQITSSGYEAGLSMARELIAGGEEAISDVNLLTEEVMALVGTLSTSVADEFYKAGGITGSEFIDGLMEQSAKAEDFASKIRTLIEMGLEPAAIRQVLAAGYEAGGRIADELIAGGVTVVDKVNQMYAATETLAKNTGEFGANRFFKAGVDMAQALVDAVMAELKRQESRINSWISQMQRKIAALDADSRFKDPGADGAPAVPMTTMEDLNAVDWAALAKKTGSWGAPVQLPGTVLFNPMTYDWAAEGAGSRSAPVISAPVRSTAATSILSQREILGTGSQNRAGVVIENQYNTFNETVDFQKLEQQMAWMFGDQRSVR
jgi:hypothetical protein